MANITIFPETTRSDFGLDDVYGYCTAITQNVGVLEIGVVYTVVWDGTSYDCVGIDANDVIPNAVAIGNLAGFGSYGQGEPFAIAYIPYDELDTYIVSALADSSTTHTFAIYEKEQAEPDPEPEPDIVLKDYNGEDMFFSGVEKVALENAEGGMVFFSKGDTLENIDIELDFTNGNQTVEAPRGYLVKGATIQKPEELKPENIVKGKEIAGVTGAFEVSAETKTIDLDFSSGDMVVTPSEGKALSQVDIPKPETLVPENIAKDVTVAGIVGTHEGGGDGGDDDTGFSYPEWIDDICFWAPTGTLVAHYTLSEIKNVTELPQPPEISGLTFVGWNFTHDELKNVDYPRDVGAMYTPTDGKTHIKLSITNSSYLTVPLNYTQTVDGGVTISWGDGSTSTPAGTSVSTTHKYSKTGNYEIVLTVADGCTLTLGGGTSATSLVGSSSYYKDYITEIHMANGVELSAYATSSLNYCKFVILPNTIQNIPNNNFCYSPYNVKSGILPNSVVSLGNYVFNSVGTLLRNTNKNGTPLCVPDSVQTIGTFCLASCKSTYRIVIPKFTTIGDNSVYNSKTLLKVFMSDEITSVGSSFLAYQPLLSYVKLSQSLTSVGASFCAQCDSLKSIELPNTITTIGSSFMAYCSSLESIIFPSCLTSSLSDALTNIYSFKSLTFPDGMTSAITCLRSARIIDQIILNNTNPALLSTNNTGVIKRYFVTKPLASNTDYSALTCPELFLLGDSVGGVIEFSLGLPYNVYVRDEFVSAYKTKYSSSERVSPHYRVYPISQYTGKLPPEVEEALKQ